MTRTSPIVLLGVSGIAVWVVGLWIGPFAPLVAGILAGLTGPRRGAFRWPALGAFAGWAIWFITASLTSPVLELGQILSSVLGLPSLGGMMLPLLACILAGVVAGVASVGVSSLVGRNQGATA